MINLFLIGLILSSFPIAFAYELDFDQLCQSKQALQVAPEEEAVLTGKSFAVIQYVNNDVQFYDKGLCNAYNGMKKQQKEIVEAEWRIRFYASHSFTHYFDTDLTINSTRYNIEIKDYSWMERGSREYFLPKTWFEGGGNNPAQIIDEPTNTFTISFEKGKNVFFISAFHPKFLQQTDQIKHIVGNIDGVDVDHVDYVNTPFYGYSHTPGESKIVRNQNTHLQMEYSIGYARRFEIMSSERFGSLALTPGISLGVMMGSNFTVVVKEGAWWDFEDHLDPLGIQGYGFNLNTKAEWRTPNERFGVFYEAKYGQYYQNHGFLDGTQSYTLKYLSQNVGMSFNIYSKKKKKMNDGYLKF